MIALLDVPVCPARRTDAIPDLTAECSRFQPLCAPPESCERYEEQTPSPSCSTSCRIHNSAETSHTSPVLISCFQRSGSIVLNAGKGLVQESMLQTRGDLLRRGCS